MHLMSIVTVHVLLKDYMCYCGSNSIATGNIMEVNPINLNRTYQSSK